MYGGGGFLRRSFLSICLTMKGRESRSFLMAWASASFLISAFCDSIRDRRALKAGGFFPSREASMV